MTTTRRQNSILIGIAILLIAALAVTFPGVTSSSASYLLVNTIEPVLSFLGGIFTNLTHLVSNLI